MKNVIICKTCQSPNPFHQFVCINCKGFLRDRVYNIDFWQIVAELIATPKSAFTKIIFSEQKNFILLIILLTTIKQFINSIFFYLTDSNNDISNYKFTTNYLIVFISLVLLTGIFTILIKVSNFLLKNTLRVKDIFSVLSYTFIPHLFALVILFPLELIFFGGYLFSNNPSPFVIKETASILFLILEILIVLWSFFLTNVGLYTLTNSVLYSVIVSLGLMLIYYLGLYFHSVYFFINFV